MPEDSSKFTEFDGNFDFYNYATSWDKETTRVKPTHANCRHYTLISRSDAVGEKTRQAKDTALAHQFWVAILISLSPLGGKALLWAGVR
mmetsp:Transcript_31242/g.38168  ORF Transcript_31242/g.38168 Transcript_31242/m.38168 type:complete len:89 (-) Transcript_31242:188-454(-)